MRGRAAGAVLTLSVIALAGCSGEPEDQPLDSVPAPPTTSAPAPTTSEPAPSTSAAPTGAPVLPPEASEQTPEGAAAFVQHWFDMLTYASTTTDTEPFLASSTDSCLTCAALAMTISDISARGNRADGG